MRGDIDFKSFLDDIRNQRRRNGLDKRDLSDRRLTLAITRVPKLKEILMKEEIKDDRRYFR